MDAPQPDPASPFQGALRLEEVAGAVLCGGRSNRFGADKALHAVAGRTLLERVLASLAPARERLLVGRDYGVKGARFVPDRRPGLGPLAGLEAALEATDAPWVALAACDLPCLTPAFWRFLCARCEGRRAVVVRDAQGRLEPLAALYHRSTLREVRARLDAGALGMHGLLRAVGAREVLREALEAACGPAVLRNVNRPEDAPAHGEDPCRP